MAVCDGRTGFEYLLDFEFIKAVTCTYADTVGLSVTGMFVFGTVALSIYLRTGSVIIPFGLLLLTGGATLSVIASPALGIATILLLGVGGGVMAYLYNSFSR